MFQHIKIGCVLTTMDCSIFLVTLHGDRELWDKTTFFSGSRKDAAIAVKQVSTLRARGPEEASDALDTALTNAHGVRRRRQEPWFERVRDFVGEGHTDSIFSLDNTVRSGKVHRCDVVRFVVLCQVFSSKVDSGTSIH